MRPAFKKETINPVRNTKTPKEESKISNGVKEKSLIFAWGLYDLANQFFALNIVSLYFVRWITIEKQAPELFYSISFGLSMFLVAIFAPFLGALSDLMHRHRFFLVSFTLLSVIFTISLGLTESMFLALIFFAIANFGCQAAVIFYNALLINIAPRDKIGLVSGIGRMLGYCGAVLGLYIAKPLVLQSGYRAVFVPSGLLFFIFALPCMLFIKDKTLPLAPSFKTPPLKELGGSIPVDKRYRKGYPAGLKGIGRSIPLDKQSNQTLNIFSFLKKESIFLLFKQFLKNTRDLVRLSGLSNFFKAMFFFLCVVNIIIIFMSVYATRVFGLSESQVINLVLFSTLFAIVGSLFSGYISDRIGYKRSLIIVLFLWGICLLSGGLARNTLFFWLIGPLVGVALGSTWVVSRALVIRIVPAEKVGAAFGLFGLVGYLSAIAGALFWGGLLYFLSPLGELGYRIALLSLLLFLLPGFFYLRRI